MPARSLSTPRATRFSRPAVFEPEKFGTMSERFARYLGTSRFLVQMTVFIAAWLAWNSLAPAQWQFDPYTFTFLTLLLSLQASYAAPLILLAQNRQDDRDRTEMAEDRRRASMSVEINSFVSRELTDLLVKLGELSADLNELRRSTAKDRRKRAGTVQVSAQISAESEVMDRLDRLEVMIAKLGKDVRSVRDARSVPEPRTSRKGTHPS